MVGAGSSWRIAMLRPGEDPIGHLAAALDAPGVIGGDPELADTSRMLLDVTLRRGTLGLVDAVRQARLPAGENLLVIVDQFEELFRFRHSRQIEHSRDEAIAFVKLLLDATAQQELPIYVALTMRSDFIGDCMDFPGLPEAVNAGLYLVGRMSRQGLRQAITGPVAVAGGSIAPRLVNRVLNDLGDDHDQLPLVQHALMRTWDHWANAPQRAASIDVEDYEAVGTFRDALSQHAEEAYEEAAGRGLAETTERVFKALTDTFTDQRGVRRPTRVDELAAISQASEADVVAVVEIFRRPGRSFLMPPATIPLTGSSIIDLSHESLMRCWGRLIRWAEEERAAVRFYVRLAQAASWFDEGTAGLWRNPELELAQAWRSKNAPTAAWARRYAPGFDRAMAFLDRSIEERDSQAAALEHERRTKLRRTQLVAGVLATALLAAAIFGALAWNERQRAERNLALAREAVDESLAAADRDPAQMGADVPQVHALRRDLLSKAERFYLAFMEQEPRGETARRDLATAHLRLGHINRMLDRRVEAEREYRLAIEGLSALGDDAGSADRHALAEAHNWLGETLRRQMGRSEEAAAAYDRALELQQALIAENPGNAQYQIELARTLSNRGILRWSTPDGGAAAETDFRESIRRLEDLSAASARALQDLGRAANNLAAVLDSEGREEARTFYERAVTGHERLVGQNPDNREYALELATFGNNLAMFLHSRGLTDEAVERSRQASAILAELARPAPSLAIERADAHNLRGFILLNEDPAAAADAFATALELFANLQSAPSAMRMPMFHLRFGDLLINLALLAKAPGPDERSRRLLSRGLDQYIGVAREIADSGTASEIRAVLDTLRFVMPELGDRDRTRLTAVEEQLRRALEARGAS